MTRGPVHPNVAAPYPGLRPFEPEEHEIFFGRGDQIDRMLATLEDHRFLAVVGASGSGKSSLVRAGLIPALEAGFLSHGSANWKTVLMRPGAAPFARLAEGLQNALASESESPGPQPVGQTAAADPHRTAFLEATLRNGPKGLVEAVEDARLPADTSLLVVVDQFEELFRFRYGQVPVAGEPAGRKEERSLSHQRNEAIAFVDLLLATARQAEISIYVVITMRSDFIGDCDALLGLPEAISESQFLTPRMNRRQMEVAITGPAELFGASVEPALVNRILNEIGAEADQLPVMQHALLRMWQMSKKVAGTVPVPSAQRPQPQVLSGSQELPADGTRSVPATLADGTRSVPATLRVADCERVGGLREALSRHADEAFGELTESQQRIAEALFRCLCDSGVEQRLTRRPVSIAEAASVAGVAVPQVCEVAEQFRRAGRSFLTPAPPSALTAETILDISHEALIRQWNRLGEWVRKEAESAAAYRHLVETARLWKANKAGLWDFPDLDVALEWKRRESPTAAWAERYGGQFDLAMGFLAASDDARERRGQKERRERNWRVLRLRLLLSAVSLLAVSLAGGMYWYYDDYLAENVTYGANFVKRFGSYEVIQPLTPEQLRHRRCSVKFIRKGRRGPLVKMQTVNGADELTTNNGISTYLRSATETSNAGRFCQGELDYDPNGNVVYEKARDLRGTLLWGFVYSPRETAKSAKAHFVGPDGYPKAQRKSNADYVEIEYDAHGFELRRAFFDVTRNPSLGPDGVFGVAQSFDERGLMTKKWSLNAEGESMIDSSGKCGQKYEYDALANPIQITNVDQHDEPVRNDEGWITQKNEFDANYNVTVSALFDEHGQPVPATNGIQKWVMTYDPRGNETQCDYFGVDGKPCLVDGDYASWKAEYDKHGNQVSQSFFGVDGKPCMVKEGYASWKAEYDAWENETRFAYFGVDGKPCLLKDGFAGWTAEFDEHGHETKCAFFGVDDKPCLDNEKIAGWAAEYDEHGNKTRASFFGVDGKPCLQKDGTAGWKATYDNRENMTSESFVGVDGKPCLSINGAAGWKATYDEHGNKTSEYYLGVDGKLCLNIYGIAGYVATFDEQGREVSEIFCGMDGKPGRNLNGIAGWRKTYDEQGREASVSFIGTDLKPCATKQGFAEVRMKFDGEGENGARSYFDELGRQVFPTAVRVTEVSPDGKGAALGLQVGDLVVRYNGQHFTEYAKLVAAIKVPGQKPRELVIRRGGKEVSYQVVPGLMGVMLGTFYVPAEPEAGDSKERAEKPADKPEDDPFEKPM